MTTDEKIARDGKILKPEGWEPPDVAGAIRDAMECK